jgi:hypothetical protein
MSRLKFLPLLYCAATAVAQTPPCFSFNDGAAGSVPFDVPFYGRLSFRFSPPTGVVASQVEAFGGVTNGHGLTLDLRLVDPATGVAVDPPLGSVTLGGFFAPPSGWQASAFSAAVPLNPFETYQIDLAASPSPFTFPGSYPLVSFPLLGADPATAPAPFAYDFACFTTACAAVPPTGVIAPRLRFRGGQCGATALATAWSFGEPCQASGPGAVLQCLPPPIPGGSSTLLFSDPGAAGTPLFVFWSLGVDFAGGTTIGPGGCPIYLEPTSTQALAAAGLQPLASGSAGGFSLSALFVTWPADPAIAGYVLGLQGVVADAAGVPTGLPGLSLRTTNGLRAVIGY